MKTFKNLWADFVSFENMYLAVQKSQKGKRWKTATLEFNSNYEDEIIILQNKLNKEVYKPGDYQSFTIHEPKERLIYAAPYRDRIVHHALMNILEPIYEPRFYYLGGPLGDINSDGNLDVTDIVLLVGIILETGEPPTEMQLHASDVNEDGEINILDIIELIQLILGV